MENILLVEDDDVFSVMVERILKGQYFVQTCTTLKEAHEQINLKTYDLILLDIMLPDGEGFQFLAHLRNLPKFANIPVMFITGRSSDRDQIMGYTLGVDDYIVKPIVPEVFQAKINAKMRLKQKGKENHIHVGNLILDIFKQQTHVQRDGASDHASTMHQELVDLTPLEFKILSYFATHEEHVISRDQLIDKVWGNQIHILDRTIDTHISHLRKKLLHCSHTIDPVRGEGYRFIIRKKLQNSS